MLRRDPSLAQCFPPASLWIASLLENTRKTWPVAQLAHYDEAVRKYHRLAKEKFEGVYLKALSYSITQTDNNGKETDALVFKKILLMDSMPSNNF